MKKEKNQLSTELELSFPLPPNKKYALPLVDSTVSTVLSHDFLLASKPQKKPP